ncbi:MAG: hypothetical protein ACLFMN_08590 [Desulfobacterales bacterium]
MKKDKPFAGSRAIPLYLNRSRFEYALEALGNFPLFSVLPIKPVKIGILVTGTK